jgi:hypothetical protein
MVRYEMIHDMTWHMIWYEMTLYGMVWCDMIWYDNGFIWYEMDPKMTWNHTIGNDMTWNDICYDMIQCLVWCGIFDIGWFDLKWYDLNSEKGHEKGMRWKTWYGTKWFVLNWNDLGYEMIWYTLRCDMVENAKWSEMIRYTVFYNDMAWFDVWYSKWFAIDLEVGITMEWHGTRENMVWYDKWCDMKWHEMENEMKLNGLTWIDRTRFGWK